MRFSFPVLLLVGGTVYCQLFCPQALSAQKTTVNTTQPSSVARSNWYAHRAQLAFDKSNVNECILNADQAIRLNPGNPNPYLLSGLAHSSIERYEQAIPRLTKYFALLKENHAPQPKWLCQTYATLSECFFAVGNRPKGIESLSAGLQLDPKSEICLTRRAEAYCQLKQFDRALADADSLIADSPQMYRGYLLRGRIDMNAGRYKNAVHDFSKSITFHGDLPEVYSLRARCYEKLGNSALASADKKRSTQLAKQQTEP